MELVFDFTTTVESACDPHLGREVRRLSELVAAYQLFVGHELANQLVPLQAFARLLLSGAQSPEDEESRLLLARLADLVQRVDRHAQQLAEVGRLLREPAWGPPLSLTDVIDEAVAEVKVRVGSAGAGIQWQVLAEPLLGPFSRNLLHAVLVHLLQNAAAALSLPALTGPGSPLPGSPLPALTGPGSPRIAVSCTAVENGCLIQVADTGIGIPDDQVILLTEPFAASRVQKESSPDSVSQQRSLGLGFFFVRQTVARWGGRLTIRSVAGQGTTVTVQLSARSQP